jgi:hypothetical protein
MPRAVLDAMEKRNSLASSENRTRVTYFNLVNLPTDCEPYRITNLLKYLFETNLLVHRITGFSDFVHRPDSN